MKIIAYSKDAAKMIKAIDSALNSGGKPKTWERNVFSNVKRVYYDHSGSNMGGKALVIYDVIGQEIHFSLTRFEDVEEPSDDIKGYIIGRFTEMLMVHFRGFFSYLEIK